jgi:crossover junction endodeoxyribonuclease RusA
MIRLTTEIPPSVNACYNNNVGMGRGRMLTNEAKTWKAIAGYEAKQEAHRTRYQMPEKGDKIVIRIYAFWPDKRRRDMNNLHKLIADAFTNVLYHDDNVVLIRDMDYSLDKKNARIELVIGLKSEFDGGM